MRAATWQGVRDVRIEDVPDPVIEDLPAASDTFQKKEDGAFTYVIKP